MAYVSEISPEECRALLRSHDVGRIAICTPQGPRIYPVNYRLDGDDVVIRTAPYTELGSALVRGPDAAFEVDELDRDTQTAWSVHVSGSAHPVQVDREPTTEVPQPWAYGSRPLIVRLRAREITGRRLGSR